MSERMNSFERTTMTCNPEVTLSVKYDSERSPTVWLRVFAFFWALQDPERQWLLQHVTQGDNAYYRDDEIQFSMVL